MNNFTYILCYGGKIKILNRCISISNLDAHEYGLSFNNDESIIIVRISNKKVVELYCRYRMDKLISINNEGKLSFYKYEVDKNDVKIVRDDGAEYIMDGAVIRRPSDTRVYEDKEITVKEIPDIIYGVAYYLNKYYDNFVDICLRNESIEFAKDIISALNAGIDKDIIKSVKKNSEVK